MAVNAKGTIYYGDNQIQYHFTGGIFDNNRSWGMLDNDSVPYHFSLLDVKQSIHSEMLLDISMATLEFCNDI